MAQQIQTLFIDDMDGTEASGTVRFALDGTAYEIDLNDEHAAELRAAIEIYVQHARKANNGTSPRGSRPARAVRTGPTTEELRAWAKRNGFTEVKDRGRIPAEVEKKYHENGGRDIANVALPEPAAPEAPAATELDTRRKAKSTRAKAAPAEAKTATFSG